MEAPIVNKVASSGIQVLDLSTMAESFTPIALDIAPFLHAGIMLRERPFREAVKAMDIEPYKDADVAIVCSADALIPTWAYMLLTARLRDTASSVTVGSEDDSRREHFLRATAAYDWTAYQDAIVVVKGCGNSSVPDAAFSMVMNRLQAVARKIMYGEPCSSVPVWRRPS